MGARSDWLDRLGVSRAQVMVGLADIAIQLLLLVCIWFG